jgi:putative component of membrane protein insertase Oxa1/YidC/SpoIIIJ protein YidD
MYALIFTTMSYINTNAIISILMKLCPIVTCTCEVSWIINAKKTKVSTATIVDCTRVYTCSAYSFKLIDMSALLTGRYYCH